MSAWDTSKVFAVETVEGNRVIVVKGTTGYVVPASADVWLAIRGAQTHEETAAALAGSMFGWDTPAAQPGMYMPDGSPVGARSHITSRGRTSRGQEG